MSSDPALGVAVVGVGRAGRVRIRDFLAEIPLPDTQLPNVTFRGFVSRRELDIPGATQVAMDDVLKNKDINAVFVCNENEQHEKTARQVLEAGKHVLVEFPLARTAAGVTDLYSIAESKGLLCYEEDISLLLASHKKAKELIQEKGVKEIQINVQGRPNGWIENFEKSGSPFVTGISMLHRVLDLSQSVVPKDAHIKRNGPNSFSAVAKLIANDAAPVTLTYERDPELPPRRVTFSYTLGDGTVLTDKSIQRLLPQEDESTRHGLFLQDTVQFVKMVRGEKSATYQQKLTLQALEITDQLLLLAKQSPQSANL